MRVSFLKKFDAIKFLLFFVGLLFLFFVILKDSTNAQSTASCDSQYDACISTAYTDGMKNACQDNYLECLGKLIKTEDLKKGNLQQAGGKLEKIGTAYGSAPKTLSDVVGGVIKTFLTLLGVIFLILMVYGGYKWMLARGDSKEVETAKDIISRALIGLIIV